MTQKTLLNLLDLNNAAALRLTSLIIEPLTNIASEKK